MQKDNYQYQNYWTTFKGASMQVVPFSHYERRSYQPRNMAYDLLENAGESGADGGDFLQMKTQNFRHHVDLLLDELGRRERVKYRNLVSLYGDLMDVYQAKVQLDETHFYTQSRQWQNVWNQELGIKKQIRSELKEMYKDTSFTADQLRKSLLEYKIQSQKYKLFSIEDALDRQETEDA
jgi:hypothetical protein